MEKRNLYLYLGIAIIVILAVLIYLNSALRPATSSSLLSLVGQPVSQYLINGLANVSSGFSNRIGAGTVSGFPKVVDKTPLLNQSKPQVLYVGAEYCPYCAVSRWGLIMALMRFGTFSGLTYMTSNATDVYPNTPTFSFYGSSYSSNYITFTAVETAGQNEKPLQSMTDAQSSLFSNFNPGGGIPFIDFGNFSIQSGAPISPQILAGQTWNSTVANLTQSNSSISESIVGSADVFTAQICKITNMTPSSVCSQPYVSSILKVDG